MSVRVKYGLLGVFVYFVFLLVFVPARFLLPYIKGNLPQSLRLADMSGSVWSGHLALLSMQSGQAQELSRVRFDFSIAPLFSGRWGYALSLQGPLKGRMGVAFGAHTVQFSDVDASMPAATLASFLTAARNFGPSGRLSVKAKGLLWGPHSQGSGVLSWRDAAIVSAPVSPLGSYSALFTLRGAVISYHVKTQKGPLWLTGHGRFFMTTEIFSFTGDVSGRGARLAGLVQNIGAPDGHGGRTLTFESRL